MKPVAQNRKARFDYEITDTIEAGIMLTGAEVKSCRAGHVNMSGSYLSFLSGKPILKHLKISAYAPAADADHDPERDRPLLLKKSEVERLQQAISQKGISVVPLEIRAGKFVKVLLGVGRGRKRTDKRQAIKERETKRRIREGRDV